MGNQAALTLEPVPGQRLVTFFFSLRRKFATLKIASCAELVPAEAPFPSESNSALPAPGQWCEGGSDAVLRRLSSNGDMASKVVSALDTIIMNQKMKKVTV